jgi:hypothetical protein
MSAVYNYRRFGETKRRHLQSQEAQFWRRSTVLKANFLKG